MHVSGQVWLLDTPNILAVPAALLRNHARRLVQAGVRFVTIGMNGWDTHSQNFSQLRTDLLPRLDRALSALIEDLDTEGILDETIVYCVGEFSRTHIRHSSTRDERQQPQQLALLDPNTGSIVAQ